MRSAIGQIDELRCGMVVYKVDSGVFHERCEECWLVGVKLFMSFGDFTGTSIRTTGHTIHQLQL